ncbi:DUF4238 domain-containing protein [Rhizobiaceae bacterium n13]|uniref:DUF4238 domain-containing protein n=1 Tax=Ferirhizobium litorale TaxID=2927786 RepID=UPI0024B28CE5|nr:DUF4238 domain-containing protein [Fererhizobium litorale]MDI7864273.1 DUF4238 domain-containing protein [Fererhizobium litorale]
MRLHRSVGANLKQKHHYIPEFYLKPWLNPGDNKLTEYRRLKFNHEPYTKLQIKRRGVAETGWQLNLYTIPDATPDTKQNIERIFMGAVDAKAALARDWLMNNPSKKLPVDLRHAWARFVLSLMLRTPEEIGKFKAEVYKAFNTPDAEIKSTESAAILAAANLMQDENGMSILKKADWWTIDTSKVGRKVLTSDHPLILGNGFKGREGYLALPIGPRRIFLALRDASFREEFLRKAMGKIVRETNEVTIGQGRRSVYAFDEESTTEVKRLMGKREFRFTITSRVYQGTIVRST